MARIILETIKIKHSESKSNFVTTIEISESKNGLDLSSDFGNIDVRFCMSKGIGVVSQNYNTFSSLKTDLISFLKSEGYEIH